METSYDILRVIEAGAEKPTHIMYKANLSWTVLQYYINALETKGLIITVSDQGKHLYHLSEKGVLLLSQFLAFKKELDFPEKF